MICSKKLGLTFSALLLVFLLSACSERTEQASEDNNPTPDALAIATAEEQAEVQDSKTGLPVRFQRPGYVIGDELADTSLSDENDQFKLKVGANITSTRGPQPLWDILKRLATLKNMSVSWASDVDQNVLVDVNVRANDDFFSAIDNLLRQVDYFHDFEDNTIIVKYKETRKYYISIPYLKGNYTTTVGGNFLTDRDAATGTEGTVKITSDQNEFDVWQNIIDNLDTILAAWGTSTITPETADTTEAGETDSASEDSGEGESHIQATRRLASAGAYYTVDRNVGMITVTAPRPLLEKVDGYIFGLKKELYRQVIIEAKIVEVYLQDNSRIGLDWSKVLKDFNVAGTVTFGDSARGGQVFPYDGTEGFDIDPLGQDLTRFVSKVTISPLSFTVLLNALEEQGESNVLSSPKITVLNGQPAVISVGKDIAYIKEVSSEYNEDSGITTYTAETDSIVEGIALGVMPTIIDDDSVILHLTPITTDLLEDPIEYKEFGAALQVGLPRVGIREMSTMVEVDNGEMLIIGGLIDKVEGNNSDMMPIVGKIPIVKYLFGVEEKILERRELVILLIPQII
jgi:general secretion pathway protein D/MSHA biogenesis protein MshL